MKNLFIAIFTLVTIGASFAQEDTLPKNWKLKARYGLNGTQSSFVNWNAGGRNNVSLLGAIDVSANYTKGNYKWGNDLGLSLGGIQYIGKGNASPIQKTDDKIDLTSSFGCKVKESWYVAFLGNFKTQFIDGYISPDDSIRTSKFMAPGYSTFAIGVDFKPTEHFSVYLSPVASKMTFVNDADLANSGAFGVEGASYDNLGNILTAGRRFRGEVGAYFKMMYNKEIVKNIKMRSKLELFSNYLNNPENIDVAAEIILNFKVNSWFSASLNLNLLYDDDIDVRDVNGGVGPRLQLKSVLGLGVSYTMRNFEGK
ncbi:MAG: DUF3078 domain-containing protein [Crocinitomicaceae bacterium]|nr:DUF3078 domain-containing protein [Crocinitomicaceae bacterium]MDG1777286.1 DUF3078 domain-containing protein [Crocinitomicaceae bacterium]